MRCFCCRDIRNFIRLRWKDPQSMKTLHTHSHLFIRKNSEVNHISSHQTHQYKPRVSATHLFLCVCSLCLCMCEVKVVSLKQLCVTDRAFVAPQQTNFLNLWQSSDSSLHFFFQILSIQVTHRALWNKQCILSKWINNLQLHTPDKIAEFSISVAALCQIASDQNAGAKQLRDVKIVAGWYKFTGFIKQKPAHQDWIIMILVPIL